MREHRDTTTAVSQHKAICGHSFGMTILSKQADEVSTRIAEGHYIRQLCPNLNSREEIKLHYVYGV